MKTSGGWFENRMPRSLFTYSLFMKITASQHLFFATVFNSLINSSSLASWYPCISISPIFSYSKLIFSLSKYNSTSCGGFSHLTSAFANEVKFILLKKPYPHDCAVIYSIKTAAILINLWLILFLRCYENDFVNLRKKDGTFRIRKTR